MAKLDDILEQTVHRRSANCVLKEQTRMSFNEKRRRESLFQQIAYLQMVKLQEDNVPRPVRVIASICKGLFALFFCRRSFREVFQRINQQMIGLIIKKADQKLLRIKY